MREPNKSDSVAQGGAANLVGIHYQLLRSLFRAFRILQLDCDPDSDEPSWSRVILEPKGGGGDLALEGEPHICVEQMKTKASGSWSLADVIHDVLPDLFRAVPDSTSGQRVFQALFVSNAKQGKWPKRLYDLFQAEGQDGRDKAAENSWLPYDQLNDRENLKQVNRSFGEKIKAKGHQPTARGLFDYIAEILATSEKSTKNLQADPQFLQRVESLLRAFEFEYAPTEDLKADVQRQLLHRVWREEDLDRQLNELLGDLLKRGSQSEPFESKELLAQYGLAEINLGDQELLRQISSDVLQKQCDSIDYRRDFDVRPCSVSPWHIPASDGDNPQRGTYPDSGHRPRILFGGSGLGKTWRLVSEALVCAEGPNPVVFVEAAADRQRTLDRIAQVFCHQLWGHDAAIPLERLHSRLKNLRPSWVAASWLDVFLDGVPSIDAARELLGYGWSNLGVRLTLALTWDDRPEALEPLGEIIPVEELDNEQLMRFLEARLGREQALEVPFSRHSKVTLIRRPLFATLYCGLAKDRPAFTPDTEFELLHTFWSQRTARAPIASARLSRLAAELPAGRRYPWSFHTLDQAGIDQDCLNLLMESNVGLLALEADGRGARLIHDRLLMWAIAEGLAAAVRDGQLSSTAVAERATLLSDGHGDNTEARWGLQWLGLVFLDLLWLLLDPADPRLEPAVKMVEQTRRFRLATLAALGPRALPLLLEIARIQPRSWRQVCEALTESTARQQRVETALHLLQDDGREQRLLGAELLRQTPTAEAMSGLWRLYREMLHDDQPHWVHLYDVVGETMNACCVEAGEWLDDALSTAAPGEVPIEVLVYLLPLTEGGEKIWQRQKERILDLVPEEKERCIAQCIEAFRDRDCLPWLEERARSRDDDVGAAARRALPLLDPDRPIDPIPGHGNFLGWARRWWLLPHLHRHTTGAAEFLASALEESSEPWTRVRSLLSGYENHISPETLREILSDSPELFPDSPGNEEDGPRSYRTAINFLAVIFQVELLGVLEAANGEELESKLGSWLIANGPNNTRMHQWDLARGTAVLKRIGGSVLARVAEAWLEKADTWWAARDAIELAILCSGYRVPELLLSLGLRDEPEGDHPIAQTAAMAALLEVGELEKALEVGWKWAHKISWDIADLLAQTTFPTELLDQLRSSLTSGPSPDPNGTFLLALGRREADLQLIYHFLKEVPADSELARMAILGLYLIEDESKSSEEAFLRHLGHPNTSYPCILGLLRLRTPEARKVLQRIMLEPTKPQRDEGYPRLIAANLLTYPETREQAAQGLWRSLDRGALEVTAGDQLDALFQYAGDAAKRWIRDRAFDEPGSFDMYQISAVRTLVENEPQTGFKATERLIQQGSRELLLPDLLLRADLEAGLDSLYRKLPSLIFHKQFLFLAAMGEAISNRGKPVTAALARWLRDPDPEIRRAACILSEVAQWSKDLQSILEELMDDLDWDVRDASVKALESLWRTREHERLVDSVLDASDAMRQRRLLDIALESGYPGVRLRQPWVARLWENLELPCRIRMKEVLKKRRKDLLSELKKRK